MIDLDTLEADIRHGRVAGDVVLPDDYVLTAIAELRAARKVVEEARKVRMEQFEALNAAIAEYEAVVS